MFAHYITAGGGREPAPVRVRATTKRSTCKSSRSPLQDCPAQLSHLLLGLLQPVRHAHLAVHRRRGGEMFSGLLALARAPVELAEAEVAVGDEGPTPAQALGIPDRSPGPTMTARSDVLSTTLIRSASPPAEVVLA